MAYEDWTTYTEVDAGGYLAITANENTFTNVPRNVDSYVYDDKGAGHFGDYTHDVDCKQTAGGAGGQFVFWGVSNIVDDSWNWANGQQGKMVWSSPNLSIYLIDKGNSNNDFYAAGNNLGTRYYTECKRVGTAGTMKIYSDAAHTNLLDTLTVTIQNTTFRYVYGGSSANSGAGVAATGKIYNLDLQEDVPETHDPADTAKSTDAVTFEARNVLEDTAKASDAPIFEAKDTIEDTAKASDSISFQMFHAHNISDTAKASDSLTFQAEINLDDIAKASDLFRSTAPAIHPCECPTFTLNGTFTAILFPKPEWANPNNEISKDISLFNFWSGDIDTVDKGINTQTLTIGGTVCICGDGAWKNADTMTTWLDSIKTASNDGEKFTVNELGNCLNGVYVIRNFTFDTLKGTVDCFTWSLNLERVRDI